MRIFSNVADPLIPTIATGINNTDVGHCEKTIKILQLIEAELTTNLQLAAQINWIVLVDDDTMLSVWQLARHLSCYEPGMDLYLGERYGYMLNDPEQGYNYVTGGGGVVMTRTTLTKLAASCQCPSASSPDDMILATCLSRYGVAATHLSLFHQARPVDYAPSVLDTNTISFHKYWQIDPVAVYNEWFKSADDNLAARIMQANQRHQRRRRQQHQSYDDDDDANDNGESADNECSSTTSIGRCGNQIIKRSEYELNHTDL